MNPFELMKNIQNMQARMQEMQGRMASLDVEGSAGGGMVKVSLDGTFKMRRVYIDPSLKDPEDIALIADLVLAASRDAHAKVGEIIQKEVQAMGGGLPIPGMPGMGM